MKIKIMCCNDTEELEAQINKFIADKIVHDIKFQSIGFMIGGTVTVFLHLESQMIV